MTVVIDPSLSSATGITLDDLVGRVKRKLADRDNVNKLKTAIAADSSTIVMSYNMVALSRGSIISIDDEIMQVWEADTPTKTLTVERGWDGTIPATHDVGAVVNIGGKARHHIVDAINDELMSISAGELYQVRSVNITNFNSGVYAYSLDELDGATVYDVQYLVPGQISDWRHLPGWQLNSIDNTITLGCAPYGGTPVRVLYKTGFKKFSDGSEDVQSDAGLQSEAADVLVWGALYRLTVGDEYIRDDFRSQGDTRRPSEVPAGAVLRATIAGFKSARDDRLRDEKDRLRKQFPLRRSGW